MSWTLLHHFADSVGSTSATKKDTTGADLIIVALARGSGSGTPTMLDDQNGDSNTYTALTESATFDSFCELYYCHNPAFVGANHFWGVSAAFPAIAVLVLSGSKATAFSSVPENKNGITSPGGTSNQAGSVSPLASGDLIVTACSNYTDTGSRAIDSSFVTPAQVPFVGGTAFPIALSYKVATGAENPTWSWSGNQPSNAIIAAFEAAAGGGGTAVPVFLTQLQQQGMA